MYTWLGVWALIMCLHITVLQAIEHEQKIDTVNQMTSSNNKSFMAAIDWSSPDQM